MTNEEQALLAIRDAAPEYSSLQSDWEGDQPQNWRGRVKKSDEGSIIDL